MPEIGKGRIVPGTGGVEYTGAKSTTSKAGITASIDADGGREVLMDLRTRVVYAEDKLVALTQDVNAFATALTGFEALITTEDGDNTSVADVLLTYESLNAQVQSLNSTLSVVGARVGALEAAPAVDGGEPVDLTAIFDALSLLDDRLNTLEPLVETAGEQITDLVAGLANAVAELSTKAEQAGVDAIAASVLTKANKTTKINTGGLLSGGKDIATDINLIVPKATSAEVDAGIIDHKAVTPASLMNVLASIRNIEEPIGIGTTNMINSRLWLPGTSGSQGRFTQIVTKNSASNSVTLAAGPLSTVEPIWTATTLPAAVSALNDINGGFEYCVTCHQDDFDPKHSFRMSVFVKQDAANGVLNFGCESTVLHLNSQPVSNPSFLDSFNLPELNKWYLLIGVVHGHTFTGTENSSGIYDISSGERVVAGLSFKSKAGVEQQKLRIYRQGATINGSSLQFARPRIDVITGEEPTIRALFGTANDLDKADVLVTIEGAGLAQGGGDLSEDRIITVEKATDDQIKAGTNDMSAITPLGLKKNIAHVLPKATDIDMAALTSETTVVTPKALRALPKATPEDVNLRTSNDVFLTPASLAGVSLGSGGTGTGTGSATPATASDVAAMTNQTRMVTPYSLTGLPKASPGDVAARVSTTVFVTPASLQGLTIPSSQFATSSDVRDMSNPSLLVTPAALLGLPKASASDVAAGTSTTKFVTPASLSGLPQSYASEQDVVEGISTSKIVTPYSLRAYAPELDLDYATPGDIDSGTGTGVITPESLAESSITTAVTNFNNGNDRNGTAIVAPVVASNGTAVDHVLNTDGSATISFEWTWGGNQSEIDGFVVLFRVTDTASAYSFDGSQEEYSVVIPADKRAILQQGVACDKFYGFAVKAFRIVDADIDADGFIYSPVAACTAVAENPYLPSANVAFAGDIIGTIEGVPVANINEVVSNFNDRNDRNADAIALPVLASNGQCIDHSKNNDGSVDISFEWQWPDALNDATQEQEDSIDGFIVYYRLDATDATEYLFTNPSQDFVLYVPADKRAIILPGVAADKFYSFGVRAYRIVDTDISSNGVIQTPIVTPTRTQERPYKPEAGVAFFGNINGTINNVSTADITDTYTNFNLRNDRLATAIAAPVVSATGTAVDHVLNNDSSCDMSFEWTWTGDEAEIDGFYVIYQVSPAGGTAPPPYAFNNPSIEVVIPVPADKRAIFLTGVAADKYYSFAVQAYRVVDPDVNVSGFVKSALVPTTFASETPYRPTENLAFVGELTGTIDGEAQAYVADAARNFNLRNDRDGTAVPVPTILDNGSALDHVINTDGSASISFEWLYAGAESAIDGFILYRDVSASGTGNDFTTPASEMVVYLPANKRSIIIAGVPADRFYSFGIRSYRIVDNDISTAAGSPFPGMIVSPIVVPSVSQNEFPYQPSTSVAFNGRITGTIGNTAVATVEAAVANFDQRNDRNPAAVVVPTILTDGTAVDHVLNTDGSATISFEWVWTGSNPDIDGFIFYHNIGNSNVEHTFTTPATENAVFVPADKRAIILPGQPADKYHSFGIRAYRIVDADIDDAGIIQSVIVTPQGAGEKPYQPSTSVAFAGDISGTINGVGVATITGAVANFNTRNDRLGTAIAAPTVATDGTAVDHITNPDGTVTVSFDWSWTGTEADIDGFMVYEVVSTTNTPYTNFVGGNLESIIYMPANLRSAYFVGVPATRFYNFGVRAYRIVDSDINNSGFIYSPIARPTIASESPYRPRTTTVIGGNDDGSGGIDVTDLVTAVGQASAAYDLATDLSVSFADYSEDGLITYVERLSIQRDIAAASAERTALRDNATTFGITSQLTAEQTAWDALITLLTVSMVPPYNNIDNTDSSAIDRAVYQGMVATWRTALQALSNAVATIASTTADWSLVVGTGRPADYATANAFRGEWAGSVVYAVGDLVTYQGSAFTVITPHTSASGSPPPNANISLLSQGSTAKSVTLNYSNQFVRFGTDGITPKPATQTLSFTAVLKNTTDVIASFTATRFNASNVSLGNVTLGGAGTNTRSLTEAQFGNASYVRITASAPTDGVSDVVSVIRIQDGEAALGGYLTNEAITLSADSGGGVPNYATAVGTFKVYYGSTDITSSCIFSVVSQSGCSVNINANTGAYNVVQMTADNATALFQAVYGGLTIQKGLSLAKSKSGDVGVTGYLSNESHIVSATSAGVVSGGFIGAGGTFNIIYGLTDVTGTNCSYSVVSSTGVSIDINPTTGVYVINSMSANEGSAILRCVFSGSTPSVTIDKAYSIAKSIAGNTGAPGNSAKVLTAVADRAFVTFDSTNAISPNPQTTKFSTSRQNTSNTINWSIKDSKGNVITPVATYLSSATGDLVDMTAEHFRDAIAVNNADSITVTATIEDGDILSDSVTLNKLRQGTNSVMGYLTNEAQALAASGAGVVSDYSPAAGSFKVYFGTTDISTGVGTVYAATPVNCTHTLNTSTGAYAVTAMSADQASLTLTATTTSSYGSVVITRVFTLAKSRAGAGGTNGTAGVNAKSLDIVTDRQVIAYDGIGNVGADQNVSLRTAKQNTSASVAWTMTKLDGTAISNAGTYLSGSSTRTNFIAYSEKLGATASSSWWSDSLISVTPNATVAPDGTTTGDLIVPTASSGIHRIQRATFGTGVIGDTVTVSIYAKAGGFDFLQILFPIVNSNSNWFNLNLGTCSTGVSGWTSTITDAGNGWYRCTATGVTTQASATCGFWVTSTNATTNYAGNGTNGVYMWGAQMAVEGTAGPYIKTDGAAITAVIGDAVTLAASSFHTARGNTDGLVISAVLADVAPITDTVSLVKVQAGATTVTGVLTNESHVVTTDNLGAGGDFSNAGGSFKVYYGTTDISTGAGTTYAAVATGCTGSINSTTGIYSVGSMSADNATLSLTATTSSTYGSVVSTKIFSLSKSKAGAAGLTSKVVTLTSDRQTILTDALGALTPSGTAQSISFTANKRNTTGTVNWYVTKIDGSATALVPATNYFSTTAAGGTGASTGDTIYMTPAQFDAARGTTSGVVVKCEVIDGITLSDTTSVIRLQAGANAINGMLSNEDQTLAADSSGVVSDYSPATGSFKVYYGSTDISTGVGTSYAFTATGCTASVNATTGAYSVSAMSADTATVAMTATTSSTYGSLAVTKTFSLSKSRAGGAGSTGAAAKTLVISSDRQTVIFDRGTASPATQTTTFTPTKQNSVAAITWTVATVDAPTVALTPLSTYMTAGTGEAMTMTVAQFNAARGASSGVVIKASINDNGVISDQCSLLMVSNGSTVTTGYLTNESAVVPADNSGTVSSFASTAGSFKVFYGSTDISSTTAYTLGTPVGCTGTINATTGAYTVTAMTADNATLPLIATTSAANGSVVVNKTLVLAKSKAGGIGSPGATAKTVTVTTDRQTILVDAQGNLTPSGTAQSVKFTANKQNTALATSWTVTKLDGTASTGTFSTTAAGGTATTTGDIVYMTPTQFDAARGATNGVIVTGTADGISDTVTILRLSAGATGAGGISAVLTNEAQVLAADSVGVVPSYSAATGTFKVYSGTTDITTGQGTTYAATQVNCTGSINATTGVYSVSAMSADSAELTLTATTSASFGSLVITKSFTLSKSRAGNNAKVLTISTDRQTILVDANDTLTPAGTAQSVKFTANKANTTGTVAWTVTKLDGTASTGTFSTTAAGGTATTTGDVVYMTPTQFDTARGTTLGVIVTGAISSDVIADTVTIVRLKAAAPGTAGVTALLTNESQTLSADNAGTVASYAAATGTFKVYSGTVDITTAQGTVYAAVASGCTGTVNSSTGVYSVTSMSSDSATLTLTATLTSTYGSLVLTKTFNLTKARTGSSGATAKTVTVTTDRQTILVDAAGNLTPAGTAQSVKFTSNKQNTALTTSWTVTKLDGTASTGTFSTTAAGGTATTTGDIVYMTPTQFDTARGATNGVIVTGTADGISDTVTILRLSAGASGTSAVSALLTNEAQVLAADSAGVVSSYAAAVGTFKVFYGTTDISTGQSTAYSFTATNCTGTINATTGAYSVSAMSADTAELTLTAVTSATYGSLTITKSFSLSKSRAGATAKGLSIDTDRQTILVDASDVLTPAGTAQSVKFTANKQNTSGAVAWSMTKLDGTAVTAGGPYFSTTAAGGTTTGAGDVVYMTPTQFDTARGTSGGVIVTASISSETLSDTVTIIRLKAAAAGLSAVLTNESQTLAADSAGNVVSFAAATGTFKVYSGTTDITTGQSTVYGATATGCTGSINSSTGVYSVTAMSAESATLTLTAQLTASYGSVLLTKTFNLTKARAGSTSKVLTVTTDRQSILVDALNNLTPSGTAQSVKFLANKSNTSAVINWTVVKLDGSATGVGPYFSTTAAGGTTTTSGDIVYMTPAQFDAARGTTLGVIVTGTATADSISDTMTILRLQSGGNSVAGSLTNEAQVLGADSLGVVTDYTPATGVFKVYYGSTDISTGAGTVYGSSTTGCTGTINASTGAYSVTAMASDTATMTLTATTSATYGSVVVTRTFTLAKSRAGGTGPTGLPARTLTVTSDRQTVAFTSTGLLAQTPQTTTLKAFRANISATVGWTIADTSGNALSTSLLSATSGDDTSITAENFRTAIMTNNATGVVITGTVSLDAGATILTDRISILKVANGGQGDPGLAARSLALRSDRQTIAFNNSGPYPTTQTTTFTADLQNPANGELLFYSLFKADGTQISASILNFNGFGAVSGAGNTTEQYMAAVPSRSFSLTAADFDTARGTTEGVIVKVRTSDSSLVDRVNLVKVSDGAVGGNAKTMYLISTRQTVNFDQAGTTPSPNPQTTTFTAQKQYTTGSVTWGITDVSGVARPVTLLSAATGDSVDLTATDFLTACNGTSGVIVTATLTDGPLTLVDRKSVSKVVPGATGATGPIGPSATSGFLTNESITLAADNAGSVTAPALAGATGEFKVFYGATEVTGSAVFTKGTETGGTVTLTGNSYVVSSFPPSSDSASIVLNATYNGVTVTKTLTLAKAKGGAAAKSLTVYADRQTIAYNTTDAANPATQTTTFSAIRENSTATVNWTVTDSNGVTRTPVTSYLSAATGLSVTMTEPQFLAARNGTSGVIVQAKMTDSTVDYIDKVSVIKVKDGSVGPQGPSVINGFLTNESATFAANLDGSPTAGNYTGIGGTFRVFDGSTEVTGATVTYGQTGATTGLTVSLTAGGVYNVTGMTSDTAVVTLTAQYNSVTLSKVFSISKSRIGSTGGGAKMMDLSSTHQTFRYNTVDAIQTQTTSLYATRQNTAVATTWKTWTLGGTNVALNAGYITIGTDSATVNQTQFAQFVSDTGQNGMMVTAEFTDGGTTYADRISIVKVRDGVAGVSPVSGFLTNESVTIAADSGGNVASYAAAGGNFRVFNGTTEVTGAAVTYGWNSVTSGLSISVDAAGVYTVGGMTPDFAVATLTAAYGGVTISKVYTIAKSRAGAAGGTGGTGATGAPARILDLAVNKQVQPLDVNGNLLDSNDFVFTATRANLSNAVSWAWEHGHGLENTTTSGDTLTFTVTAARIKELIIYNRNFFNDPTAKLIATVVENSVTYTDYVSIVQVQNGATGSTGPQGPQGPGGGTGPAGRDAMVFYQNSGGWPNDVNGGAYVKAAVVGDTWFQPDTKKWFRWNGSTWVQLLGNIASYDQITAGAVSAGVIAAGAIGANQINVTNLQAVSAVVGLLRTQQSGARVEIESNQIRVYDAANTLRVRLGIW